MSEQSWIFLAGVFVAVLAYLAKNFILQPLLEYHRVVGRIRNRLKYYANIITNGKMSDEVSKPVRVELRQLSCDIEEAYYAIPLTRCNWWLYRVPRPFIFEIASTRLIYLSNSVGEAESVRDNSEKLDELQTILKIKPTQTVGKHNGLIHQIKELLKRSI